MPAFIWSDSAVIFTIGQGQAEKMLFAAFRALRLALCLNAQQCSLPDSRVRSETCIIFCSYLFSGTMLVKYQSAQQITPTKNLLLLFH